MKGQLALSAEGGRDRTRTTGFAHICNMHLKKTRTSVSQKWSKRNQNGEKKKEKKEKVKNSKRKGCQGEGGTHNRMGGKETIRSIKRKTVSDGKGVLKNTITAWGADRRYYSRWEGGRTLAKRSETHRNLSPISHGGGGGKENAKNLRVAAKRGRAMINATISEEEKGRKIFPKKRLPTQSRKKLRLANNLLWERGRPQMKKAERHF